MNPKENINRGGNNLLPYEKTALKEHTEKTKWIVEATISENLAKLFWLKKQVEVSNTEIDLAQLSNRNEVNNTEYELAKKFGKIPEMLALLKKEHEEKVQLSMASVLEQFEYQPYAV